MSCSCDFERPDFVREQIVRARKPRRCNECGGTIQPGEQYESVVGKWSGEFMAHATCPDCLALREHIRAHVPCFCWGYGVMRDDALETAREYGDTPGLFIRAARYWHLGQRRRKAGTSLNA